MLDSWLPNPNVQKCLTYINMFWYGYQLPQLKQNPCCWKITWHIGPNNKITRDMPGTCLAPNPLGPSCWQELLRGFYLDSAAMPMVKFIELAEPERQSEVDEEWFDSGFVCVCVFVSFFVCFCYIFYFLAGRYLLEQVMQKAMFARRSKGRWLGSCVGDRSLCPWGEAREIGDAVIVR